MRVFREGTPSAVADADLGIGLLPAPGFRNYGAVCSQPHASGPQVEGERGSAGREDFHGVPMPLGDLLRLADGKAYEALGIKFAVHIG